MQSSKHIGTCTTCCRESRLTKHHLIPKKAHSLSKKRADLTDEELSKVILVCRTCHDAIHKFYDERTLALELNTLEKLLSDEKLKRHFKWVSKLKKNY